MLSPQRPQIVGQRKPTPTIPHTAMAGDSRRAIGMEARRNNIVVAAAVAEVLKTSLGPKGLDKMLVDKDGIIYVSNDGSTILNKMAVDHPIAKMLVEAANAVSIEVGDGTVSTVILVGALLKNCEELLNKKIHPAILVEGYIKASEEALRLMNENAITISPKDRKALKPVAMTAMSGKLVSEDKGHLADLVVEAVLKVAEKTDGCLHVDLDNINLQKRSGGSLNETKIVEGFAFFREIAHIDMPRRVMNAKILVVKGELRLEKRGKTRHYERGIVLETPKQVSVFTDQLVETFRKIAEKIANLGANVLIVEKGIDPHLLQHLARFNILAIRRVVIEDLERIAKVVGANVVAFLDDLSPEDLGAAQLVEERKLAGQPWLFFEGCAKPKLVTIMIRSEQDYALDEAERSVIDTLHAVRNVLKKPKVVAGGGASEIEAAVKIRRWAEGLPSREQLAVNSFADTLESIPLALAENSGLNILDIQMKLRSRHLRGEIGVGVDAMDGRIADMVRMKIFEPLLVKEQVIKSALETAIAILRINDYIVARKLVGSEFYEKQKEESSKPERIKEIHREYGVEGPYT